MSAGGESLSIEKLIQLLQDTDPVVRIHAGFVLGTMDEDALPAIPILIEMLKHGEVRGRKLAALTLGQIGPAAVEAIPALFNAANDDEDEDVSDLAMWALEEIDLADEEPEAEAA
jgi:HEAT repeat protein